VPVRTHALAAVVDVDGGPMRERPRDRLVRGAVVLFEVRERLVREDDAPAERHARGVALEDCDLGVRPRLLVEERKVEPGRTTTDADDLHVTTSAAARVIRRSSKH